VPPNLLPYFPGGIEMKIVVPLLGWLIFGCVTVSCITKYGTQWDFSGRFRMPTTLLSPDGKTYRDGSPIDEITKMLVDRGIEQEFWLVAVGVILVGLTVVAFPKKRFQRKQETALDRELRRIYGVLPREDERK